MALTIIVQDSICGYGYDVTFYNKEDESLIGEDWVKLYPVHSLEAKYPNSEVIYKKGY